MNKIWSFIILLSIIYGLLTNRIDVMIDALFEVPKSTISVIIIIGSSLIIWNGLFKILQDSDVIKYFTKPLCRLNRYIFVGEDKDVIDLISLNMIANMIGLGPAATPIGIEAIKRLNKNGKNNKNMFSLLALNIGTISFIPASILTIRGDFSSKINLIMWISIIVQTFIIFLFSILVSKIYKGQENDF